MDDSTLNMADLTDHWLNELLRCPSTGEKLKPTESGYATETVDYPRLGGLPYLLPKPSEALARAAVEATQFIDQEQRHLEQLQGQISAEHDALLLQRLRAIEQAKQTNLNTVRSILAPIGSTSAKGGVRVEKAFDAYFQLLFRDWCWQKDEQGKSLSDDDELDVYADFVESEIVAWQQAKVESGSIDSQAPPIRVLLLGGGAGGLGYRLVQRLPCIELVSVERNPLLALGAAAVSSGEKVELCDYSLYPRSLDSCSQHYSIKVPSVDHRHAIVMADFPALPFEQASFDVIVAPWFFDILPMPTNDAIQATCYWLKPDGALLSIGPSNVHKDYYEEQFTPEEFLACFKRCFDSVRWHQKQLPYLHSPLNSQLRLEHVLFAVASKRTSLPEQRPSALSPQSLVHYDQKLLDLRAKLQTIYAVLSRVDQDLDEHRLAQLLVSEFGFDASEAPAYAQSMLAEIARQLKG